MGWGGNCNGGNELQPHTIVQFPLKTKNEKLLLAAV